MVYGVCVVAVVTSTRSRCFGKSFNAHSEGQKTGVDLFGFRQIDPLHVGFAHVLAARQVD
jgi:hypothetical protein